MSVMTGAQRRRVRAEIRAEHAALIEEAEKGFADSVRDALNLRNDRIDAANATATSKHQAVATLGEVVVKPESIPSKSEVVAS